MWWEGGIATSLWSWGHLPRVDGSGSFVDGKLSAADPAVKQLLHWVEVAEEY